MEKDTMCDVMSDDLRVDILRIIPERISEVCVEASTATPCLILCWLTMVCRLLLVSLNIDAILGEATIFDRRKRLNEMTTNEGTKGKQILTWNGSHDVGIELGAAIKHWGAMPCLRG